MMIMMPLSLKCTKSDLTLTAYKRSPFSFGLCAILTTPNAPLPITSFTVPHFSVRQALDGVLLSSASTAFLSFCSAPAAAAAAAFLSPKSDSLNGLPVSRWKMPARLCRDRDALLLEGHFI